MILDATFRIQTTIAGISANAIQTGGVRRTVAIGDATTDFNDTRGRFAAAAAAADVTIGADTDHGADWHCGRHLALSRLLTGFQDQTRIDALFIDTGQTCRTIRVLFAHWLRCRTTVHIGITEEVRWTTAHSHVVLWMTLGTW